MSREGEYALTLCQSLVFMVSGLIVCHVLDKWFFKACNYYVFEGNLLGVSYTINDIVDHETTITP